LRSERQLTEWLRKKCGIPAGSEVVLGIGDDCAIYRPRGSRDDLLFTTDLFLEDVHFLRRTHTAADAGRVAISRGLSDIAAMGGEPRFVLVSLSVPTWADGKWVRSFFRALTARTGTCGAVLAGGDLSHSEKLACDVVVCGAVPKGKALLRSGAQPGDAIYVSGRLGGSALGLETEAGKAWKRHVTPEPRVAVGREIRTRLRATACIDISDGLSLDLERLCLASNLAAEITEPPIFPGATLGHALHGGEEYELLFTVPETVRVPSRVAGVSLTRIGQTTSGKAGQILFQGERMKPLGYDHFRLK
jgi:thiamine-monophosphate kinase